MAYARCAHTGLPMMMCGHCNGTHAPDVDGFRGRRPEDDTPHVFKGRDKHEWRGIGQSIRSDGSLAPNGRRMAAITQDTLTRGSCTRPAGFSTWAREQALRTTRDVAHRRTRT